MNLLTKTEQTHQQALAAMRRAIRAGDLVKAERWLKLAERQYRLADYARDEAARWRKRRLKIANGY